MDENKIDSLHIVSKVTRLEVIDGNGKAYIKYFDAGNLLLSFQDDGKTLKLII